MAEEMIPYKQWVSVIKDINIATSDLEKLEILESQMKFVLYFIYIYFILYF